MEISKLTAVELGKKIKSGELKVTDVTKAYLDRIEKFLKELK